MTYVRAPNARAALLRSKLVGKRMRQVLAGGGELELLSVDYVEHSRQFQLRAPAGGSLVVPVTGTGPIYYVNNYGGCTDDPLVKRFLPI